LRSVLQDEILAGFGVPVVFKNVICGFQASLLASIHRRSLFIHVTRDPVTTGCSILNARMARYGSYSAWWSLKPSTFDQIRTVGSPAEEVALQVRDCRRELEAELSSPAVHAITLSYESICRSPDAQLERVCDAIRRLGGQLRPLDHVEPLVASDETRLSEDLQAAVAAAFDDSRAST
jgi:hypothetical protein